MVTGKLNLAVYRRITLRAETDSQKTDLTQVTKALAGTAFRPFSHNVTEQESASV